MENLRYKYYRLGQEAEKIKDYSKAVEYYQEYSSHLADKDKHIPYLWIHELFLKQSDHENALKYLLQFCEGCSMPNAAKILKEKSKEYEVVNPGISNMLKEKSREYQKELK